MFPTAFYSSLFCFKTKPQISDLLVWEVPYLLRHVVSRVGKETDSDTPLKDYGFRMYDTKYNQLLREDLLFTTYPWCLPSQIEVIKPFVSLVLDGLEDFVTIRKVEITRFKGTKVIYLLNEGKALYIPEANEY
jgi:hypothetical protein